MCPRRPRLAIVISMSRQSGSVTHAHVTEKPASRSARRERPQQAPVDPGMIRAAVLDAALDGIVTIDEHGDIREFNAAAELMFGYKRTEVIGRSMVELLVPADMRADHLKGFGRYLETGVGRIVGHRMEVDALKKDGATFPVELAIARIEIDGRPAFTAYIRDQTEKMEADTRLAAAHKRYRDLIESLPVVVYEADFGADGAWSYVSPKIEGLLGFKVSEWLADPNLWFQRIHLEDRDLVLAQERALRMKKHGERVVSEYRMFTRSGDTVWVRDEGVVAPADGDHPAQMRGVIVDITERKELEAKLSHHAFYDILTGLPNRALFMDRLEHVYARSARSGHGLTAVLFLDIDDFKFVNDTLGHAAGDSLLAEIGSRLTGVIRPVDTAARFGGDEFTILLEDVPGADEALHVAARLAEAIAEPIHIGERDVSVTASVGIGVSSDESIRAYDLVSQADIAMYRAKENGKARAELFDAAMGADAWQRLDLQRDLRHALERGELTVMYQPVIDLKSGDLTQVEALVRWRHPQRGLLLPTEFIPFAESTGFVGQIDRFVLGEACRQLASWRKSHSAAESLGIAVNLSPREFRNADIADDVARVLEESGLPATCLTLEITESASLVNSGALTAIIGRLSDMGVQLVIDDFGVGYSGLDHFKRFKVHGLKIDRSFVAGVANDQEDSAIVTAALAFGRALGLSVVAEGIETQAQLNMLKSMGCERGQGFLISEAVPALQIEKRLLGEPGGDAPRPKPPTGRLKVPPVEVTGPRVN
jgi:diguanylate cyclase (GGDEF)-like protein/PAS domain S-box-containing protein